MEHQNEGAFMPQADSGNNARPTFLTVLCILSFVGIGLVVLSGIINLFTSSSGIALQMLQNTNSPFGSLIENPDEYLSSTYINNLVGLIAALGCLAGVIMMWKLNRTGFYIYAVAEIIPPIVALVLSGRSGYGTSPFASIIVIALIISLIFAIAFIIMYAANLKHLN